MWLLDFDGIVRTELFADAAFDTNVRVNHMCLTPFTSDGVDGAVTGAERAACAGPVDNFKADQRFADFRRATFLVDMSLVFIEEMFQGALDRVRSTLAQPAEAVLIDLVTKVAKGVNFIRLAVAFANPGKDFQDAACANPAGGAFCLLYTSPSPRDRTRSRMPSSA